MAARARGPRPVPRVTCRRRRESPRDPLRSRDIDVSYRDERRYVVIPVTVDGGNSSRARWAIFDTAYKQTVGKARIGWELLELEAHRMNELERLEEEADADSP